MIRHRPSILATRTPPHDRQRVAAALREVRRRCSEGDDVAEACGWALALRPDSRAATRCMVDYLLSSGHANEALTMVGQSLLREPGNGCWLLRRATALHRTGRLEEAAMTAERAQHLRPWDRRVHMLVAEIALERGDVDHAVSSIARINVRPHEKGNFRLVERLIQALLACRRVDEAAALLERIPQSDAAINARVRLAEGRVLEAREALEDALADGATNLAQRDRAALETFLIEVLDQSGDWPALRDLAQRRMLTSSASQLLARTCMHMGDFTLARSQLASIEDQHCRFEISCALDAAEARAADSLRTAPDSNRVNSSWDLWLAAIIGRAIAAQLDSTRGGRAAADPHSNVLGAIRRWAHDVLRNAAFSEDCSTEQIRRWHALADECNPVAAHDSTMNIAGHRQTHARRAA